MQVGAAYDTLEIGGLDVGLERDAVAAAYRAVGRVGHRPDLRPFDVDRREVAGALFYAAKGFPVGLQPVADSLPFEVELLFFRSQFFAFFRAVRDVDILGLGERFAETFLPCRLLGVLFVELGETLVRRIRCRGDLSYAGVDFPLLGPREIACREGQALSYLGRSFFERSALSGER